MKKQQQIAIAICETSVRHANNMLVEALSNAGTTLANVDAGARDALRDAVRAVEDALHQIRCVSLQ